MLESSNEVILLGASLDTGNLGVSALFASTVQCLTRVCPGAPIWLLEGARDETPQVVPMANGRSVTVERLGIRCNKTIWRRNHLLRLVMSAIFARMLPARRCEEWLARNSYLSRIRSARGVLDITGGDSFSDIYGVRRFLRSSLYKVLVLLCEGRLVLLPQTYGPFKSFIARRIAGAIVRRTAVVYSRDREGLAEIGRLTEGRVMRAVPMLCPDVAFVLDGLRSESEQTAKIRRMKAEGYKIIGLNVSGLLYHGGYTGRNGFGLKCDYKELVKEIVSMFVVQDKHVVVLVPHVIPKDFAIENDLDACRDLWRTLSLEERKNVIVLDGNYDQSEVKYLIGLCDFFIGARMHSTIAALSQCVPAVGTAYSRKFAGVFESVGIPDCVVDCRIADRHEITSRIHDLFQQRADIACVLKDNVARAKRNIMIMFQTVSVSDERVCFVRAAGVRGI